MRTTTTFAAMWPVIYFFTVLGALLFIAIVAVTVYRLSREQDRRQNLRRLLPWLIKGFILPFALWVVMNLGISWRLQPFMPQVQAAQNSGANWIPAFLHVIAAGLFAVSSYWAAVTLGWVLFKIGNGLEGEDRADFRALCVTSLVGTALPAIGLIWGGGWITLGLAIGLVFLPIAGYAPAVLHRAKLPPMYSSAIAKMNFGKYAEAEWEIIRQLEKWENDSHGWLMLAELYANKFQDLAEAEQIILEICDQPNATPSQISVALHKLADWHLKAGDPDAARRALEVICGRLPGTHLARMARVRSAQVPRTAEELREQNVAQVVPMPALSFEESPLEGEPPLEARQATALANQLSERLTYNPNDIASRERLARVLAGQLGKADLAIEQIELLLGMSEPPPESKRAEWLGLIAAWQLRFNHDPKAARQIIERVVNEFPNSPQAFAAQRRLNLMAAEEKREQMRTSRPKLRIVHEPTEPPVS